MCGLPTETDEDVLQIAGPGQEGDRRRPRGHRQQGHPLHGVDRRVRAQAAHAVPVGGPARPRGHRRPAGQAARRDPQRPGARPGDRLPLPRRPARHHRGPALPRRPPGRRGHPPGLGGRRPLRRLERALLLRPLGRSLRPGLRGQPVDLDWYTTREREQQPRCCPGTTSTPGLDKDWLWEDWQDALNRGRGRGLPLDPVLRLRRLPADGHRDPDRPDRQDPAAADPADPPLTPVRRRD